MNSGQAGWLMLFVLALFLVIVGIQGNLGVLTAIVFCPKYIIINSTPTENATDLGTKTGA